MNAPGAEEWEISLKKKKRYTSCPGGAPSPDGEGGNPGLPQTFLKSLASGQCTGLHVKQQGAFPWKYTCRSRNSPAQTTKAISTEVGLALKPQTGDENISSREMEFCWLCSLLHSQDLGQGLAQSGHSIVEHLNQDISHKNLHLFVLKNWKIWQQWAQVLVCVEVRDTLVFNMPSVQLHSVTLSGPGLCSLWVNHWNLYQL